MIEATVVSEVLVIAVVPSIVAAMSVPGPIMLGILATAAPADMPTTIPIPTRIVAPAAATADVSATTTTPARVVATATTHSTEVATSTAAKVATSAAASTHATAATASAATDEGNIIVGRAERSLQAGDAGIRLPHYYRGEKPARATNAVIRILMNHLLGRVLRVIPSADFLMSLTQNAGRGLRINASQAKEIQCLPSGGTRPRLTPAFWNGVPKANSKLFDERKSSQGPLGFDLAAPLLFEGG